MKAIEFQNLLKVYLANNLDGARELADRFEVAISTVTRWRDGTARPICESLNKLLLIYKVHHEQDKCPVFLYFPWHFLYFFPEPHQHGSLRPIALPSGVLAELCAETFSEFSSSAPS